MISSYIKKEMLITLEELNKLYDDQDAMTRLCRNGQIYTDLTKNMKENDKKIKTLENVLLKLARQLLEEQK